MVASCRGRPPTLSRTTCAANPAGGHVQTPASRASTACRPVDRLLAEESTLHMDEVLLVRGLRKSCESGHQCRGGPDGSDVAAAAPEAARRGRFSAPEGAPCRGVVATRADCGDRGRLAGGAARARSLPHRCGAHHARRLHDRRGYRCAPLPAAPHLARACRWASRGSARRTRRRAGRIADRAQPRDPPRRTSARTRPVAREEPAPQLDGGLDRSGGTRRAGDLRSGPGLGEFHGDAERGSRDREDRRLRAWLARGLAARCPGRSWRRAAAGGSDGQRQRASGAGRGGATARRRAVPQPRGADSDRVRAPGRPRAAQRPLGFTARGHAHRGQAPDRATEDLARSCRLGRRRRAATDRAESP